MVKLTPFEPALRRGRQGNGMGQPQCARPCGKDERSEIKEEASMSKGSMSKRTMSKRTISLAVAISSLALGAAVLSAAPVRISGFGPAVADDATLNASLGVLSQQIAWLNSPESDAYQLAQAKTKNADFEQVAQMSTGSDAQGHFPSVSDDSTLNRANGIMSQLIAWQNSSQGDAFMIAQTEPAVTGENFERVAMASLR